MGVFERQETTEDTGVDLTAVEVTGPVSGLHNQRVTLEWTGQNIGTITALGPWRDTLYLSTDSIWTSDDILLGEAWQREDVGAGGTYTASAEVDLPAVLPGDYCILAIVNGGYELYEGDLLNNPTASAETVAMDLPELSIGVPLNAQLTDSDESKYYKIDVPAGESLNVHLTGPDGVVHELYLKEGGLPSRQAFDQRGPRSVVTHPV